MQRIEIDTEHSAQHPRNVVSRLLAEVPSATRPTTSSVNERCITSLERRAPEIVATAERAGAELDFLGVANLFSDSRFYEGDGETDWILGPADGPEDLIVPRAEGKRLRCLADAGIDGLVFIAHEVEKAKTVHLRGAAIGGDRQLSTREAAELTGPVPAPAASVALDQKLAHRSGRVGGAARSAAKVAGATALGAGAAAAAVAAAPALLVGAAFAGLATLDPIVLIAVPAISARPGSPAGWFLAARWNW